MQARCPTCGKQFEFDLSTAKPFCSERCRLIDLGGWLSEKHSIPVVRKPDEEENGSEASSDVNQD